MVASPIPFRSRPVMLMFLVFRIEQCAEALKLVSIQYLTNFALVVSMEGQHLAVQVYDLLDQRHGLLLVELVV